MTNSELLFSWDKCGLNLYIPENSLPENLQQCSIHIETSIRGDYQLPQDAHLVSAVYWIECVPKCQFSQPLTLEIEHCAKPENVHKLCFIRTSSVDEGAPFQTLDGNFMHCSSFGFVEVNSFSKYGIAQKGSEEREYCSNIHYYDDHTWEHQIHFTIHWNTKSHNKVGKLTIYCNCTACVQMHT